MASLRNAGFVEVTVKDERRRLQASNRLEIAALEGLTREKLAAIVGREMADNRLASAQARQAALDSGDLIPSHQRGRKPL